VKATIDHEGYLKIEVGSIVESMSDADLRALAKYAVFQEVLLAGVVDALVDGHMWNDDPEPAWWMGGDTFNKLRMKLAPLLPDVACKAVQHLERETRQARAEARAWRDACWKLERDWPEARDLRRDYSGEYHRPMSKDEARAFLAAVEARITAEQSETSDG
jgi:hypothetical protein